MTVWPSCVCLHGAATGSILNLVLDNGINEGRNAWEIGMNAFLIFMYIAVAYPDILPKGTLPKPISPKRTSPKGILPNVYFAERTFCRRTFCRTDFSPKKHFSEQTICRK
jgi:hypothetical protein